MIMNRRTESNSSCCCWDFVPDLEFLWIYIYVFELQVATIDKLAQPPLATVQPNDVDKEGIASLEGEVATNDEADLSCLDNLMDASQKRRNSQWILIVGGVCLVSVLIFAVMQTLPKFNAIRKGTTALKEQSDLNGAHSIAKSYLNYSP